MQPSKQPHQQKVSHPHNSASGKAVSHTQHQAQLWDKNDRIKTNISRFHKGKTNPSKKSSKNIMEPFKRFCHHRVLRVSRKQEFWEGFVNSCSPLGLFCLLPPTVSLGMFTYGSFDLGIKVPSSFIRSLILNLLLRSTSGKTAQMLQVIFTLHYKLSSVLSKHHWNVCLKLKIQW